jgi:hypothetical protein
MRTDGASAASCDVRVDALLYGVPACATSLDRGDEIGTNESLRAMAGTRPILT